MHPRSPLHVEVLVLVPVYQHPMRRPGTASTWRVRKVQPSRTPPPTWPSTDTWASSPRLRLGLLVVGTVHPVVLLSMNCCLVPHVLHVGTHGQRRNGAGVLSPTVKGAEYRSDIQTSHYNYYDKRGSGFASLLLLSLWGLLLPLVPSTDIHATGYIWIKTGHFSPNISRSTWEGLKERHVMFHGIRTHGGHIFHDTC